MTHYLGATFKASPADGRSMPRERVASFDVERVSVLDPDGGVDEALVPDVGDDELREWYRTMRLSRRLDERAIALQRRGEIGTYAPAIGQEATQVAASAAMREDDWLVPAFREQAAALARGADPAGMFEYFMGREEGAEIPAETNALPTAIPVGSQALHAVGVTWAERLRGTDRVGVTYVGDGATSEGDVLEALNFAGVLDTGTVFVCQNNQYAISTPRSKQSRAETLAQKAVGAGIDCVQVDGNDVLGSYAVLSQAVERAREGHPTLVEALTYRRSMHTTADDPTVYRTREEEAEWERKDPIARFEAYLRRRGLIDDAHVEAVAADVEATIDDAVERAKAAGPAAFGDVFEHVYAEAPATLRRQAEERRGGRRE